MPPRWRAFFVMAMQEIDTIPSGRSILIAFW
jgi:hypothetical protein